MKKTRPFHFFERKKPIKRLTIEELEELLNSCSTSEGRSRKIMPRMEEEEETKEKRTRPPVKINGIFEEMIKKE